MKIVKRSFFDQDTILSARALLGKVIVRRIGNKTIQAMVAEAEAYRSDEPACHAYYGETEANSPLFGEVGHTYVYVVHGHFLLNIVSRDTLKFPAGGILIRSVVPIEQSDGKEVFGERINGPGRVADFLHIDHSDNKKDVTKPQSDIMVVEGIEIPDNLVEVTPRIGIHVAVDLPWRFVLKNPA